MSDTRGNQTPLTAQYSGVAVNQNAISTGSAAIGPVFQDFYLPANYVRGPESTAQIPAISGIQLMMQTASINVIAYWGLDHFNAQGAWDNLMQNTLEQVPYASTILWAQMNSSVLIAVDPDWVSDRFRLWLVPADGSEITDLYYASPNPLAALNVHAYMNEDGSGPILDSSSNQVSLNFRVMSLSADSGTDILGNQFRSVVLPKVVEAVNPVAGDPNIQWMSRPNPSKFAVESLYAVMSTDLEPVVVDSILFDPITPGMTFNVYYSSDGYPAQTTSDWDSKLWTRVPMVYTARKRDTYYLPRPVTACYFKIEMTNLQAQQYRTKVVQPVSYQRFPSWVLTYFLAQYESGRLSEDYAIGGAVNVVFDLLDYAYSYTTEGIASGVEMPMAVQLQQQADFQTQLTQDLSRVDLTTLQSISSLLLPFAQNPTALGDSDSLLASVTSAASAVIATAQSYPQEVARPVYTPLAPYTSSRVRDPLMQQKQQPDMYFYVTCRHTYRQSTAKFTNDRAYFAGVRELAFLRDNYNIPHDSPVYWEVFGDGFNRLS